MTDKVNISDFRYKDEKSSIESIEKLNSLLLSDETKANIAKQLYTKCYLKYINTVNEHKKTEYFKASSNFLQYIHILGEALFLEQNPENDFGFLKFLVGKRKKMDPLVSQICEYLNSTLTDNSKKNYVNLIALREEAEQNPEKHESMSTIFFPILEEYIQHEKECAYQDYTDNAPSDINEEFEFYLLDLSEAKKEKKASKKKAPAKKSDKAKPKKKRKSYKDDPDYEKPEYKRGSDVAPDDKYPGPYGGPTRRFNAKGDVLARFKKDYGEDWRRVYFSVSRKIHGNWLGRGKTELPRSKWTRGKDNIYRAKKNKREDTMKNKQSGGKKSK